MEPFLGVGLGLMGICFSFCFAIAIDDDFADIIFGGIGVLSTILFGMSVITGIAVTSVKTESSDQKMAATPIISVANSTSTEGEGSFGFGSGSFVIATDEVYRYYYETPEGIKQGKVPASETIIKYTDETPTLLKITDTTKTTEHRWWFYHREYDTSSTHYELLIPEGSVVNQFNLN